MTREERRLAARGYFTTQQLVDLWTTVAPVLKSKDEGRLLNTQLVNLLAALKVKGVKVPDVSIFDAA